MYKKIIVPLDGSKLAEQVLPHVEQIARGCGVTEVVLITVTERIKAQTPENETVEELRSAEDEPGKEPRIRSNLEVLGINSFGPSGTSLMFVDRLYTGRRFTPSRNVPVVIGKMAKAGKKYLAGIAEKLEKKDIPVGIAVLYGNVADEIVHFSQEENADLIIMASKGRKGLRRWDVANAADRVFRNIQNIPIMLIKPPAGFKETKPARKGKPV